MTPAEAEELLAVIGRAAEDSLWTCDDIDALGPYAAELRLEAAVGPIPGSRFVELAAMTTQIWDGVFEAVRPGDDRPWLVIHTIGTDRFAVATRSRRLLGDLRRRFGA